MASLSRAIAGVAGRSLIVNLPGSPRGATESLDAIAAILGHALDTLAGPYDHEHRGRPA
jgi:molybdopterin biosynthesis enzyme MoaB